jgi:hypothetical protein
MGYKQYGDQWQVMRDPAEDPKVALNDAVYVVMRQAVNGTKITNTGVILKLEQRGAIGLQQGKQIADAYNAGEIYERPTNPAS